MQEISFPKLGLSFNIDPIALTLPGGMKLHWYGIIIGIGMFLAVLLAYLKVREKYENAEFFFDYLLITIPLSIIGARCYYVIFSWAAYKENLKEVFFIWHGGLAIYGAVIVGAICTIAFTYVKKIPLLWFMDICASGCIIAQSIGRWGNFVNGEAYGSETSLPWGMKIGNMTNSVHPTFLYESIWNFIGFIIMYFIILRKKRNDGSAAAFYLIWYGAGRFFIESLRSDSLFIGSIKVSQIVAVLSVFLGCAIAFYMKKKRQQNANVKF